MSDTQPTGLDLDEILLKFSERQVGISKGITLKDAKQALTRWGLEQRIDEIKRIDAQFPDLWKRNKMEYTEADMWKLAHYIASRPDELQANLQDGEQGASATSSEPKQPVNKQVDNPEEA